MLAPWFGEWLTELTPADFMPFSDRPARSATSEQDPGVMFAQLEILAARFNAGRSG